MYRISVTVETKTQADAIRDLIEDAEFDGELDFSFGLVVEEISDDE